MKDKLEKDIDICPIGELLVPLQKSNAFIVDTSLDFLEVSVALAQDEVEKVQEWVQAELLRRPDPQFLFQWEQTPDATFRMVIIKPFLLIQQLVRPSMSH